MDCIILSKCCPALKEVCWNFHVDELSPEDLFELYEIKWKYINHEDMCAKERALIKDLAPTIHFAAVTGDDKSCHRCGD